MLFAGLGSVRMVKNCDLRLENAALGLRPRAAFSSPRSQFFTIRTSQPVNNIYLSLCVCLSAFNCFKCLYNTTQWQRETETLPFILLAALPLVPPAPRKNFAHRNTQAKPPATHKCRADDTKNNIVILIQFYTSVGGCRPRFASAVTCSDHGVSISNKILQKLW